MSALSSEAQNLFEQYERKIKEGLESAHGYGILKKLHEQLSEETKKLNLFLEFMIELFGERLDEPTSKETELFNRTKNKFVAAEKAIRYCEYYIRTRYGRNI